jgi:hypothetical protein
MSGWDVATSITLFEAVVVLSATRLRPDESEWCSFASIHPLLFVRIVHVVGFSLAIGVALMLCHVRRILLAEIHALAEPRSVPAS